MAHFALVFQNAYVCIHTFFPPVLSVIIFVPAKSEQAEQLQISQKLLESRQQPTHQAAWWGKADMIRLRCIFPTENWSQGGAGCNEAPCPMSLPCHWFQPPWTCGHSTGQSWIHPHLAGMAPWGRTGKETSEKIAFGFQCMKSRSWQHLLVQVNTESIPCFCCHGTRQSGASDLEIHVQSGVSASCPRSCCILEQWSLWH